MLELLQRLASCWAGWVRQDTEGTVVREWIGAGEHQAGYGKILLEEAHKQLLVALGDCLHHPAEAVAKEAATLLDVMTFMEVPYREWCACPAAGPPSAPTHAPRLKRRVGQG